MHSTIIVALLLAIVLSVASATTTTSSNQTKPLCYSGSTLYQKVTQDCSTKDPSYTGDWYCATIEICESFIDKERECVQTRGCATEQECVSASSSSGYFDGNTVQVTSGINPAGMTITATCCQAYNFPSDDAIAIDYTEICNSASSRYAALPFTVLALLLSVSLYLLHA